MESIRIYRDSGDTSNPEYVVHKDPNQIKGMLEAFFFDARYNWNYDVDNYAHGNMCSLFRGKNDAMTESLNHKMCLFRSLLICMYYHTKEGDTVDRRARVELKRERV